MERCYHFLKFYFFTIEFVSLEENDEKVTEKCY